MVSAVNSAISGLDAASTKLNVSATNIANQFSTKSSVNGKTVSQPYTPQKVNQVSQPNGGVQAKVSSVSPATVTVSNPSSPTGTSQTPNVNTAQELVNQQIASYDFQANLKTIQIANQTLQNLLDIKT